MSTAGDVNGDGEDDLLIGAPFANPNGDRSGASYVVFGGAGVGNSGHLELSALDGTNGFRLSGVAPVDRSGGAVSTAGDVNGDGVDDLLIGATGADPNGNGSGASYVVFVSPVTCNGLPATLVGTFGNGTLFGTPGNDVIWTGRERHYPGSRGRDVICGGAGDDRLIGNQGKDQLFGEGGNDLMGGTSNDRLFGQSGDDTMDGGLGNDDNCNGGSGTDTATSCEQPRGVP